MPRNNRLNAHAAFTGSGTFPHNEPEARLDAVYAGTLTVHTGPDHRSHLTIPVIPD